MAIVTLTTDLGTRDHYAASLKGTLLSMCPEVVLVDITHDISKFNVLEAAFILRSAFPKFPPGSIHLIGVDPEGGSRQSCVVVEYKGHLFVAPDNGVLSLITRSEPVHCFQIGEEVLPPVRSGKAFLALRQLAPVAAMLAQGKSPDSFGPSHDLKIAFWGEPTYTENSLRGIVLHVDHFGNAITNITKEEFLRIKGSRSFQIFIRNVRLQRIVNSYGDVARGEALAIFSESEHLEIAMREGSAAQLLGLKSQDMLTIEFYG